MTKLTRTQHTIKRKASNESQQKQAATETEKKNKHTQLINVRMENNRNAL